MSRIRKQSVTSPPHQRRSIVLLDIPDAINDRNLIFEHFSQFGELESVSCSKKFKHSVVHFIRHEDALVAKNSDGTIDPNYSPIKILWSGKTSTTTSNKILKSNVLNQQQQQQKGANNEKQIEPLFSRPGGSLSSGRSLRPRVNLAQANLMNYITPLDEKDRIKIAKPSTVPLRGSQVDISSSLVFPSTSTSNPSTTGFTLQRSIFGPITSDDKPLKPSNLKTPSSSLVPSKSSIESTSKIKGFSFKMPTASNIPKNPFLFTSSSSSSSTSSTSSISEKNPFKKAGILAPSKPLAIESSPTKEKKKMQTKKSDLKISKPPEKKIEIKPKSLSNQQIPTSLTTFYPTDSSEANDLFLKRSLNSDERYRILEARDKLIRLKNPKVKMRVENAVTLKGTCCDMCPEKERYMREVQRNLSSYEFADPDNYEVDHIKAIKAYSRSSADQEEPLPHELRPSETLDMTMNYILHKIISKVEDPDEDLSDWYNFVWDRTRSIRKDITQQQLCDDKAISLLEKCARFHIFCSSRLCELDVYSFEPKLNDENLMKCLQSLEHMYFDLLKRNIHCPNEPEFRAYQILMNLNEGDILWEILEKSSHIINTPEIKFAIKIHLLLYQKNYVGFFRMVKNQASYLTSCVLHRYFPQIRTTALRNLSRATKTEGFMSMTTALRMLGYGPDKGLMLKYFCEEHGILCDIQNSRISINRKKFYEPDNRLITREHYLIDSKMERVVNEIINGGPLAELKDYCPRTSFDKEGALIPGDTIGIPQNKINDFKPSISFDFKAAPTPISFSAKAEASTEGNNKNSAFSLGPFFGKTTSKFDFGSSTPSFSNLAESSMIKKAEEEARRRAKKEELATKLCEIEVNKTIQNVLNEEVKNLTTLVYKEQNEIKRQQILKEKLERKMDFVSDEYCKKIIEQTVNDELKLLCKKQLQNFNNIQNVSAWKAASLLHSVLRESLSEITYTTFEQIKKDRLKRLSLLIQKLNEIRIKFWIQKWKDFVKLKKLRREQLKEKRKKELENFPPWHNTSIKSNEDIFQNWCGGEENIKIKKIKLSPKVELKDKKLESAEEPQREILINFPVTSSGFYQCPESILKNLFNGREFKTDFNIFKNQLIGIDKINNLLKNQKSPNSIIPAKRKSLTEISPVSTPTAIRSFSGVHFQYFSTPISPSKIKKIEIDHTPITPINEIETEKSNLTSELYSLLENMQDQSRKIKEEVQRSKFMELLPFYNHPINESFDFSESSSQIEREDEFNDEEEDEDDDEMDTKQSQAQLYNIEGIDLSFYKKLTKYEDKPFLLRKLYASIDSFKKNVLTEKFKWDN